MLGLQSRTVSTPGGGRAAYSTFAARHWRADVQGYPSCGLAANGEGDERFRLEPPPDGDGAVGTKAVTRPLLVTLRLPQVNTTGALKTNGGDCGGSSSPLLLRGRQRGKACPAIDDSSRLGGAQTCGATAHPGNSPLLEVSLLWPTDPLPCCIGISQSHYRVSLGAGEDTCCRTCTRSGPFRQSRGLGDQQVEDLYRWRSQRSHSYTYIYMQPVNYVRHT